MVDLALAHFVDLIIAYALAVPIGWERERADRSAGIRTFPLVAVASCAFLLGTESILQNDAEARARIIEGVITGMGFIGVALFSKPETQCEELQRQPAYGLLARSVSRVPCKPMTLPYS